MNSKEATQALLDGKKIRNDSWADEAWIMLGSDGEIVDDDGENDDHSFGFHEEWELFQGQILSMLLAQKNPATDEIIWSLHPVTGYVRCPELDREVNIPENI